MTPAALARRRKFLSTASGLTLGGLAYFLTLLNYSGDLTRTALAPGYFSHFFDIQARALLAGHLNVPEGSLGIEGFIHGGKTYTYFPPFPALLRLPVIMTTHEYDARLTVLSMTVAWIVFAVMVTKLVWLLLPDLSRSTEVSRRSAVLVALFLASATGGTFLTYDASLPWVYHEVYVWAVAAAMGGMYWMVRVQRSPDRGAVKWLFVFALIAVGVRATEGWAICLVVIAMGLLMRFRPPSPEHARIWWRVTLAGVVPLAASIILNEIKFDSVYMFPLQDQVWTMVNAQRRAALAANGGTLTGTQFFTTSFMAYLRLDGIRFVDYFPWITLPAHAAPAYQGAVVDQTYRTGSATSFMPVFMLMVVVAFLAMFKPRTRPELKALRAPMVTAILITGGVMGYGYYANRYTTEFVPALVLGGAVGTCLLSGFLDRHHRWRVPAVSVVAVGAVFSILAQMATGLSAAAYNHRGQPLERYVAWQHEFSPSAQAKLVGLTNGLPEGGHTDDLAIRGNCDALYINTGDKYEPWLPVQERDRVLRLSPASGHLRPGTATLLRVTGTSPRGVDLEVSPQRLVRFVVWQGSERTDGPWFDAPTDGIRLGVRNLIDFGSYEFDSIPGGVAGYLPSVYFDTNWDSLPALLTLTPDSTNLRKLGFVMTEEPGVPLQLCHELATAAALDLPSS